MDDANRREAARKGRLERDRIRAAAWRKANPAKARAAALKWQTKNRDHLKAYRRARYADNKTSDNARCREYHAAHRDRLNRRALDYYREHRDELMPKMRARAKTRYYARVAAGLCGNCSAPLAEERRLQNFTLCQTCWLDKKNFVIAHLRSAERAFLPRAAGTPRVEL
jgi:hypothetical protein